MGGSTIRLFLVDDHLAFRQPLVFMFGREPDLNVVAQAGSIAEARQTLAEISELPDVALVDLLLPDGDGVTMIRHLRAVSPSIMVLVLTGDTDMAQHARAIEAGAIGVLTKSARVADIIDAIRMAFSGKSVQTSEELIEFLRLAGQARERDRMAQFILVSLTPRERQVLEALAEGLDNRAIADRLSIRNETARTHVVKLLAKLGVESRLQAAIFAIRNGIGPSS
jgi:two-component system nitrate/nitrite response regulator NarL